MCDHQTDLHLVSVHADQASDLCLLACTRVEDGVATLQVSLVEPHVCKLAKLSSLDIDVHKTVITSYLTTDVKLLNILYIYFNKCPFFYSLTNANISNTHRFKAL